MSPRLISVVLVGLAAIPQLPAAGPGIALGQPAVSPQGNTVIDINFTSLDEPVTALQFDIKFPSQVFTLSASAVSVLSGIGKNLWTSNPDLSSLRILIAGINQTVIPSGVIATLSVQSTAKAPSGIYPLEFDNAVASDAAGMAVFLPANNGSVSIAGSGPSIAAVANAASWTKGALAPGEIVVIGGAGMGGPSLTTLQITAGGQVATTLDGTRVLFDGIPAPLIYSSQGQVSAIVPYEIAAQKQTALQVEYLGNASAPFPLPVAASAPGLFTADASGSGQGAIVNQDGTMNGPNNPALRGSIISIYGTGDGQTLPGGKDGIIIGAPSDLRYTLLPVNASIGGQNADVIYAGSVGGQVAGMFQANVRVPSAVGPGSTVPVILTIGANNSQTGVTVAIQ